MITTFLATSAVALGLSAVFAVDPIVINKTTVPYFVEFKGYNGSLITKMLRDRIRTIARDAQALRAESVLSYFAEGESALSALAGEFKIGGILNALQDLSSLHTYTMACNIVDQGDDYKFTVKGETATGQLFSISVDGTRDIPTLVNDMAERFIARVDPYILSIYYLRKEYESGNFEKALPIIEHSIRVLPVDRKPWVLNLRGRVFHRQGDYDNAITKYREALALNPDFVPSMARWGLALIAKGDRERGLAKLHEALDKPSSHQYPIFFQVLGDLLATQGQDVEARDIYVRGLRKNASNAGLQTSLAVLYLRHNQFKPALNLLQKAATQQPTDPRVNSLLPQALAGRVALSLPSN